MSIGKTFEREGERQRTQHANKQTHKHRRLIAIPFLALFEVGTGRETDGKEGKPINSNFGDAQKI